MSAVEASAVAGPAVSGRGAGGAAPAGARAGVRRPARWSTRLLRSELGLIFGRRRNLAGMAVLAAVPVIIAVAVYYSAPEPGDGPPFLAAISGNGLFVALVALTAELPLFLPLAVAAIAGDAVAGEAHLGTLRYLLTVPVARTRLLAVKFGAIAIFTLAATLLVAAVGGVVGVALFGSGPVTLLSGTQIGFGEAVWRLALVCAYVAASLLAVGALGLFVSTLTEQPIGATIAVVIITVTSHILETIPQLSAIHPYLFTHYWLAFGDLLRDPMATELVWRGLATTGVYVAVFCAAAWARFAGRDVTS